MATIKDSIRKAEEDGYFGDNAEAKVCQDIVLKALSHSSLSRNATVKGGVVMRSITGDSRRATLDIDIDFIRYSLDDASMKLRSLLKFGNNSTRYKDVFDMCYLSKIIDRVKLDKCFNEFIFSDPGMKEKNVNDILRRVNHTFSDERYLERLSRSRQNWLNIEISDATKTIIDFLSEFRND